MFLENYLQASSYKMKQETTNTGYYNIGRFFGETIIPFT